MILRDPLIPINEAPTGSFHTKDNDPAIPGMRLSVPLMVKSEQDRK
jgi:hypothetical protein